MTKGRILVADDDLVFQALFEAAAIEANYDIECVNDGNAAVAQALELNPDLIFLDQYMPGKTGLEVCVELHEALGTACPPIIIVTGADAEKDINRAFSAGALDYLVKPVNWLLLQYRITRWIEAGKLDGSAFEPGTDKSLEVVLSAKGVVLEVVHEGAFEGLASGQPAIVNIAELLPGAAADRIQKLIRKTLRTRSSQLDRIEVGADAAMKIYDLRATPVGPTKVNLVLAEFASRQESHSSLFRMAYVDQVTGLPNQHLFTVKGKERLLRADFEGCGMTVVCLAIEGVSHLDVARLSERQALAEITTAMNNVLAEHEQIVVLEVPHSSSACIASFDGRYCLAMFENHLASNELKQIAKRMRRGLEQFGGNGRLKVRLGYARFPEDGATLGLLVESAHYAARMAVREQVDCHNAEIAAAYPLIHASDDSETAVYDAMEKGQIQVHYQPRIDLVNEQIEAAEALIRWCHPVFGTIAASEVFQALTGAEAVRRLCDWAAEQALKDARKWSDANLGVKVTINLAHEQVLEDDFADQFLARLQAEKLDPSLVELEVAESVLDCSSLSIQQFEELGQAGVGLIIDDFGKGKVSLSTLRRLRISGYKVDRHQTRAATMNLKDSGLYSMAHAIAATSDAVLVAKNLESAEELEFAKSRLCDQGQGFHICQPLPHEDFQTYVQRLIQSETSPLKIAASI
jgi:EAL domain-containing protein (putative c-di-GMP-specific phosphodiesterase class I)/CheY-like chemotaxis protein/GGDEF domain-containing protein